MKKVLGTLSLVVTLALAILFVPKWLVHADVQYPLCAKGRVLSYRGYAVWNGTSLVTDNTRQGVNPYETILRATTLASSTFGFQNSAQVDGQIYAQPLYMSGVRNSWVRSENAVFVATEHGSVYALDAYTLATKSTHSLLPTGTLQCPSLICQTTRQPTSLRQRYFRGGHHWYTRD